MHEVKLTVDPRMGRLPTLVTKKALLIGTYTQDKGECVQLLEELSELADTYGLETALMLPCPLREIHAATFIGKGKVEEIAALVQEHGADVVIFDDEISPQQQRNLEEAIATVVIDRTELILGVFAQRAQTREAKIQIELANFRYQMPRLRGMWNHLHRQRSGGAGGGAVKGEGEKQIELDRRIIKAHIERLQKDLNEVKKQRDVQRKLRERTKIPTFAIVGYTNAGKSTLLKKLTDADVLVEDKLFATLDPTTRKFVLPNNQAILLTDTVGFIRKIPHQLVAAFKSTLEEALHADILLHLIDASNFQAPMQADATFEVLKELKADKKPIITVLNKIDLPDTKLNALKIRVKFPKIIELSSTTGQGIEELMQRMISEISRLRKSMHLRIAQSEYALISELMREGKVLSCDYEENDVLLEVEVPLHLEGKFSKFLIVD